jgi:hypothetical protein
MRRAFVKAMMLAFLFIVSSSAAMAQRETICAGTPVPAGWVKVNDFNSFLTCGNPIAPNIYNVWVIERYDNRFRGDRMVICSTGQPPAGWGVINTFWDPLSCGHPAAIIQNMMIIECLNCAVRPPDPQPTGPDYEGWIDVGNCDNIAGWVWNKRAPTTPLRVDILANGAQIAQVMADVFRQDLQNAGKGDGRHSFTFPTPARLKNSRSNTITIRVTNTNFFLGSPKTFTCANPIDDTRFFVRQHYVDFLGREPDQSGWDFWSNEINQCGSDAACRDYRRIQVSKAFFLSIEFQNTGYYVHRFYRASFARMPTLAEFGTDKAIVSQGVIVGTPGWDSTLNFNKVAFANTFAARSNFTSVYNGLSNQQFVDQLFANAQVAPDTNTRNDLIDGLNTGRYSRGQALRLVVEYQPFIDHEFNPAFVMMQYMGYLRRHPSDPPDGPNMPGYFFWLNDLNSTGDQNHMVDAFLKSAEYRNRFGSDQPWPGGSTSSSQASAMSTQTDYSPTPPCEDWDGDAWCDPPVCEDWDGDGNWDYCG